MGKENKVDKSRVWEAMILSPLIVVLGVFLFLVFSQVSLNLKHIVPMFFAVIFSAIPIAAILMFFIALPTVLHSEKTRPSKFKCVLGYIVIGGFIAPALVYPIIYIGYNTMSLDTIIDFYLFRCVPVGLATAILVSFFMFYKRTDW